MGVPNKEERGSYHKKTILATVAATPGGDAMRSIELDLSPNLKSRPAITNTFAPPVTESHNHWYDNSYELMGIRFNRLSEQIFSAEIGFYRQNTLVGLMQNELTIAISAINNQIDTRGGSVQLIFNPNEDIVSLAFTAPDGFHRITFSDNARTSIAEFARDIIQQCGIIQITSLQSHLTP